MLFSVKMLKMPEMIPILVSRRWQKKYWKSWHPENSQVSQDEFSVFSKWSKWKSQFKQKNRHICMNGNNSVVDHRRSKSIGIRYVCVRWNFYLFLRWALRKQCSICHIPAMNNTETLKAILLIFLRDQQILKVLNGWKRHTTEIPTNGYLRSYLSRENGFANEWKKYATQQEKEAQHPIFAILNNLP